MQQDKYRKKEYILRLSGKASIPAALEIGHNYTIRISGSIVSKTEEDSQGEEVLMHYKFVPVLVEVITATGETIKSRDIRSRSKQLRAVLYREWQDKLDQTITSEEYYDRRMTGIIQAIIEGKI